MDLTGGGRKGKSDGKKSGKSPEKKGKEGNGQKDKNKNGKNGKNSGGRRRNDGDENEEDDENMKEGNEEKEENKKRKGGQKEQKNHGKKTRGKTSEDGDKEEDEKMKEGKGQKDDNNKGKRHKTQDKKKGNKKGGKTSKNEYDDEDDENDEFMNYLIDKDRDPSSEVDSSNLLKKMKKDKRVEEAKREQMQILMKKAINESGKDTKEDLVTGEAEADQLEPEVDDEEDLVQEDFAVDEEIEDNGDGEHDEGNEGQNEQQEEGEDIVHGTEKIRCVAKERENTKVSKPCVSSKFEGGGVIVIKKSEPKHEMKSCNDKEKGENNYEKVTEESTQCEAISSKDTGELDKPTQPGKGDGEVKKTEKISQLEDINYTESAQSEANASRSQEILVLEQSKDTEEVINPNKPEEVKEESAQLAFSSKDTGDLVKPTQPVKGEGDVEKMEKIGELEDNNFTESAQSEAKTSRSKEMMTIEQPKDTAEIEPELPLGGQDDTQPEELDQMAYTAENIAELEVGDDDEQGTVPLQALRKEAGIPDKENIKVNPIDSQKPKQGRHTSRKSKISPRHFFQQNEVSTEVASDGSDPKSEKERRTESADTSVQPAKTDKKKRRYKMIKNTNQTDQCNLPRVTRREGRKKV